MSLQSSPEQLMLDLINQDRAAAGVGALTFSDTLNDSSEDHSSWMLSTNTFDHTGIGGSTSHDRMVAAGYTFSGSWTSGENIAYQSERGQPGIDDDVADLHASLMNSPGHRANILNPAYTQIGIGIETGIFSSGGASFDSVMVTQNFAFSTGNNPAPITSPDTGADPALADPTDQGTPPVDDPVDMSGGDPQTPATDGGTIDPVDMADGGAGEAPTDPVDEDSGQIPMDDNGMEPSEDGSEDASDIVTDTSEPAASGDDGADDGMQLADGDDADTSGNDDANEGLEMADGGIDDGQNGTDMPDVDPIDEDMTFAEGEGEGEGEGDAPADDQMTDIDMCGIFIACGYEPMDETPMDVGQNMTPHIMPICLDVEDLLTQIRSNALSLDGSDGCGSDFG